MSKLQDKINALYAGAIATNSADDWRALVEILLPKPKGPKARKGKSRWVHVRVEFADSQIITLTVSVPEGAPDSDAQARAVKLARQFRAAEMPALEYQQWLTTHGAEMVRLLDSHEIEARESYYAAHPMPEAESIWQRNAAGRLVKVLVPRYLDMVPQITGARVLLADDMAERARWRESGVHPDHVAAEFSALAPVYVDAMAEAA